MANKARGLLGCLVKSQALCLLFCSSQDGMCWNPMRGPYSLTFLQTASLPREHICLRCQRLGTGAFAIWGSLVFVVSFLPITVGSHLLLLRLGQARFFHSSFCLLQPLHVALSSSLKTQMSDCMDADSRLAFLCLLSAIGPPCWDLWWRACQWLSSRIFVL